jgi:hypothetical protein
MEDHISDLVRSIVSGVQNWKPDFTDDLPQKFIGLKTVTLSEAKKDWNRYVDYLRWIDIRSAKRGYLIHRDEDKLAEDLMVAYYESAQRKI